MEETIQAVTEAAVQTSSIVDHLDAIITVLITIIGFIVTYFMTKKNFKDEVKKNKIALASEQIQSLPYDICQFMDDMLHGGQDDSINQLASIISKVLAYGSHQAVKIVIKMQRLSYETSNASTLDDKLPLLAAYSLLITQLKYDLTSEIISPESWCQLRMTDYSKYQTAMISSINGLVHELGLNSKFKV